MNRVWHVLDWNIRGVNSPDKWLAVCSKIDESNASIVCLQETKKESFDANFIRGFAPKRFDQFVFSPSDGASGGLLVLCLQVRCCLWNLLALWCSLRRLRLLIILLWLMCMDHVWGCGPSSGRFHCLVMSL